jgi:hypothetical protein
MLFLLNFVSNYLRDFFFLNGTVNYGEVFEHEGHALLVVENVFE